MKAPAILQSYDQNIFRGAAISASVAPITDYALTDLGFLRPDFRVQWSTGTVTVTWDVGDGGSPSAGLLGDIFVIPVCNLWTGAATLTNDAGLSQALTGPDLFGRWPKSLVVDLTLDTPDEATRTSDKWHLVIAGNPEDVILGGGIALYSPKQYLVDRDFQWGYTPWFKGSAIEAINDYQTLYRQNLDSLIRGIDLSTLASDGDADRIAEVIAQCGGHARAGLLWFDPHVNDAFLGHWAPEFRRQVVFTDEGDGTQSANQIGLTFTELSKGRPLS